jgi:hypothetical protein
MRVSALGVTITGLPLSADSSSISAKQGSADLLRVSAIGGDANTLHVSAVQGDAGLMRVSTIGATVSGTFTPVPLSADSSSVSAKQQDAANLRISATSYADTVGDYSVALSLSVSASQNIKSTAGAVYGWHAWNTDTKTNYIKLYNVSAALNLGTDTPIMVIPLPASAAANVEFMGGLKGFTNGIGIAATSGAPLDNTALPAASSVGINLFYV